MKHKKIIVAGTVAFDTIETNNEKKEKIIGGSANYFALAASNFTKVELSAIVGTDFPKKFFDNLNKRGIGTSNIETVDGETFHWIARYEHAMNMAHTIDTKLNVLPLYNPRCEGNCEILFLANVEPIKQLHAIERSKNASLVITDTMNYWIKNNLEDLKKVLLRTDIFIINEEEARMLSGEININQACAKIVELGPEILIIKRGEYGSFLYKKGELNFYIPAFPLKNIVDPTGAGDSFAGGFVGYLSTVGNSYKELKTAMLYGAATSSFTVEGFGAEYLFNITKEMIEDRVKELIKMITL